MLYAFIGFDHPDSGSLRAANRPEHLEFLTQTFGDRLKGAGAHLDEETGESVGSIVIVEGDSLLSVMEDFSQDPYAKVGLFLRAHVVPWKLGFGAWAPNEP